MGTCALLPAFVSAADALPPPPEALVQRSAKIVDGLELADTAMADRVTIIIARNYEALSYIHDQRDADLEAAKALSDEAARKALTQGITDTATARMADQIALFLGELAADLTPAQIDAVKDGLTYGVLPKTFRVYQEMLPDMTPEQSRQIYAWLYEAREHAISAGSSKAKHGWFGKYKGRINNYLAKAGIDMKAAEKAMFDRKKAAN
ncbi:DUF3826 domain-containing protein [Actomonas aquatica]|uniref:DUF3826 domain-containing protein n=1 Tax=Actomonas aquatica TaxID=2866162 RepID=A0ABZ1CEP2_9BACT|nr:DUF3826 domain-containing protein [Opitutus sp. WL0086]WRQ90134.1 DUF3826 domain-containing protein [Opitutus sp. WL0086]